MQWQVAVLALFCGLQGALAGRAFPVEAENNAIDLFQTINPLLKWDPTNFLVDLSGQYSQCKNIDLRGAIQVDRTTAEKATIGGLVDSTAGTGTDSEVVTKYINTALSAWLSDRAFSGQIARAERFGCSVQPGCRGRVSIACLFSPEYRGPPAPAPPPPGEQPGGKIALAFTTVEYEMAEDLTGVPWDRSHFLENLSGFETDCSMIWRTDINFKKAKAKAMVHSGIQVDGLYGSERNTGSTPSAIEHILQGWKWFPSKAVGCSVIPDCVTGGQMYVVVSCLFRE